MKAKVEVPPVQTIDLEELKKRYPLWDTAFRYTKLFSLGRYWKGKCPIEKDSDFASFMIKEVDWGGNKKAFFYCFQCRKGGDVFSLLANIHGKTRYDMIKECYERSAK